jgi:glutamate/tyrosine decarboxylase-like PLP-dependent enzyme
LNVVCFRYVHPGLDEGALDLLNKQIEIELQEAGIAVVSTVVIHGTQYLHAAITNHRTRREDLELLVSAVIRMGAQLASSTEGVAG